MARRQDYDRDVQHGFPKLTVQTSFPRRDTLQYQYADSETPQQLDGRADLGLLRPVRLSIAFTWDYEDLPRAAALGI
jgi:hypothetical protein